MAKWLQALRKEFLILVRDVHGLVLLFLMPVLLLVVVTLAQENAIRSSRNARTDLLFISRSGGALPDSLEKTLDGSGFFRVIRTISHHAVTEQQALELIRKGDYPMGIVTAGDDSVIRLWVDPSLQASYRQSLISTATWLIKSCQARQMTRQIFSGLAPGKEKILETALADSLAAMPGIREEYPVRDRSTLKPTIIQNNIPGFILFAMFFIVIPLSGSMITEKTEGSFLRLKTLPVSPLQILIPKVILYLGACLVQFFLMLAVGIWFFHGLFGYPALDPGRHYLAILASTLASGLAAVGFGLLVGAGSRSHSQSALMGSILVVILGVISGTFLPVYLLPEGIRRISLVSPVRWGIDNYLELFVRDGRLRDLLPNIFLSLLFFVFAIMISLFIFARRK
ncbi:MAG TPA: ABC transporter permease [Bacteroidales bacterium]|nr:ABC transporter permease [Bacteroidales bacterium]